MSTLLEALPEIEALDEFLYDQTSCSTPLNLNMIVPVIQSLQKKIDALDLRVDQSDCFLAEDICDFMRSRLSPVSSDGPAEKDHLADAFHEIKGSRKGCPYN